MRTPKLLLPGAVRALAAVAAITTAITTATFAVTGCDEEPIPLFDEQGSWALILFDIDGKGLTKFDVGVREEKFMIHFNQELKIVAAAGCKDSMGRIDITQTLCDNGQFACRCFNYEFMETQMFWTEVPPKGGKLPDPPPKEAMEAGVPSPGEQVAIGLEAYPEAGGTYRYSTLPYGLFNSNGDAASSEFVFQSRNDVAFMATGCMEACSIPVAAPEGG